MTKLSGSIQYVLISRLLSFLLSDFYTYLLISIIAFDEKVKYGVQVIYTLNILRALDLYAIIINNLTFNQISC